MKLLNGLRAIPFRVATRTMLVLLSAILCLHILALLGVIPAEFVWGGRISSYEQMLVMESVALIITILMFTTVAAKAGYFKLSQYIPRCYIDLGLWLMVVMLLLNTVGNIAAQTNLEVLTFTPLSLLGAICCARIALEE